MRACLKIAFEIVNKIISGEDFDLSKKVAEIKIIARDSQLGVSTQTILDAASRRNIPWRRLSTTSSLFQLGYGKNRRLLLASTTDQTSLISTDIVQDKFLTKNMLKRNFLPSPDGVIVERAEDLKNIFDSLKPPFVVKPYNGNQGKGVVLNVTCPLELNSAFHYAQKFSDSVLIEEMVFGNDYRILIVDKKFVAAALRNLPIIKGDGASTIQELIDQINADPLRGDGHENLLTKIFVDQPLLNHLKKQHFTLNSIPKKAEVIILRGNANLSSGGMPTDVTAKVHPDIIKMAERTARIINLDICGLDLIHDDISLPANQNTKIIEVNAAPGLRMHLLTDDKSNRDIGGPIIEMLYPDKKESRIPIISVTGTNGKTTVARLIYKIMSGNGLSVGLTTTDGIWIGSDKIAAGDTTGPISTEAVLADPQTEAAVLEVARGGLVRGGLAYDWSDVSVITNIRADHIGQDGIESIDDLIWIKSLVAVRVRPHGTLVLNANDPAALSLLARPKVKEVPKNIFLYSQNKLTSAFNEHLLAGGNGCWFENGYIYLKIDDITTRLIAVEAIPITLGGVVPFQIDNALVAVAAATALKIAPAQIVCGLKEFLPTESNVGRLGLYKIQQGHVIVDYGHNPDALAAVGKIVDQYSGFQKTVVIGLPGDRADNLIVECAEAIAKSYHRFIIKEDDDLRGRRSGEVSHLLQESIVKFNPNAKCKIILQEKAAIAKALLTLKDNDLVVIFYDQLTNAMETLKEYDPTPVIKIPPLHVNNLTEDWQSIRYVDPALRPHELQ